MTALQLGYQTGRREVAYAATEACIAFAGARGVVLPYGYYGPYVPSGWVPPRLGAAGAGIRPMTRAELMKKLSSNPRFREAEKSGRAYVIPGAKQPGASCATSSIRRWLPSEGRPQITHRRTPLGRRGPVGAPRSVSHFTFGRRKICEPHLAKMRDENASHRMGQLRRPGRARPALVGCRDVQIGPHSQRGNQLGLDAVRMALAGPRHCDSNGTVRDSSGRTATSMTLMGQ